MSNEPYRAFLTKCFKLKLVYHRSNQEICRGPHWLNIFSSSLFNGNWIIYLIQKTIVEALGWHYFQGPGLGSTYGLMTLFWASINARSDEFTFERLTIHVALQSDVCYSEALQIIPSRYSGNVGFYNHLLDGWTEVYRQRQGF